MCWVRLLNSFVSIDAKSDDINLVLFLQLLNIKIGFSRNNVVAIYKNSY